MKKLRKYFYRFGAYAEYTRESLEPPDEDQWQAWLVGEMEIIAIDRDLHFWEPGEKGEWVRVKEHPLAPGWD